MNSFYATVLICMLFMAVYGASAKDASTKSSESVQYESDRNFFLPGVRKTFNCKGVNRNQKVEWINPAGDVVERVPSNRVFVQEHFVPAFPRTRIPVLMLVLTRTSVEDTGVWECRAGDVKQNVSLCIIDPSQFVDTPTEVNVDNGRSITLTCQARGDPEPRIVWYRNGEIITDDVDSSKYRVMTKYNSQGYEGLLTIMSLQPDDSGAYTCAAVQETPFVDDCIHRQDINISLQVNHAPIFKDGDDVTKVYGTDGESVELVCSADGYPVPTYRWFIEIGDTLSEFAKEEIQLLNDGTEAVLNFTADISNLDQSFTCRATNQYGVVDKTFMLLKIEKPKKPSMVEAVKSTDNKIQLKVTWQDEKTFPVYGFYVQYLKTKSVPREVDWKLSKTVQLKPEEESDSGSSEGLFVTLTNLAEDSNYWIRLRGVNNLGSSTWSDPISASTVTEPEDVEETVEVDTSNTTTSEPAPVSAHVYSDSTFYGIFFAGGILVLAVACMFFMRLV